MEEENKNIEMEKGEVKFSENQMEFAPNNKQPKKHLIKFMLAFVGIFVLVGGGYWIWNSYFSETAKYSRQAEENYKKYLEWKAKYEKAMTEDTYGGKTPQETLDMFIEALEKGDLKLASKYFLLREDGTRDPQILENLKSKSPEEIEQIINLLKNATPAGGWDETVFGFELKDQKTGEVLHNVGMKLNKYSNVWKIESL